MHWDSAKIRSTFLTFFNEKKHQIVSSAPMVIKDDPTLMFTNAGMNQFKEYFLGTKTPEYKRVADTQKCLRVSGKHNDLEEVGEDTYHHTMFEMLGNWSFGDYFKKEAIAWAWELLTGVYGIDKSRLYVTVFGGDESDGTLPDEEAENFWKEWIDPSHIFRFGRKDNFWEMGETGPCGPCSEIHIDLRDEEEIKKTPAADLINADHPLVVEIWNLVFIQFTRQQDGSLQNLPSRHVDTGMGLERLAMVLQGKKSNYDTDVFMPLIREVEKISGKKYTAGSDRKDVAFRVLADHVRAVAFAIADGQLPSNTGAGYVIRRILRRGVRYAYSFLDVDEPVLSGLVQKLTDLMGGQFPELKQQKDLITKVIREEEENFLRTLSKGLSRFEKYSQNHHRVKGDFAFELYDTYGFPIDLTRLLAAEKGMVVDIEGFNEELQAQKERSRKATKVTAGDWVVLREDDQEEFIGYDYTKSEVFITRYRKVSKKGKDLYQLVFNITPFYPEGGGQVGDTGKLVSGSEEIRIIDTKKENNLIVHFAEKLPADPMAKFEAVVDEDKRELTANNHSATHLLHYALRKVLGEHVEQKGSMVNSNYLRFDFSHFQKMSKEEIRKVEAEVNRMIRKNIRVDEKRDVPMPKAKEMGAMSLFGEKYGDLVRVIRFDDSVELCGGTHVDATGRIGCFKITSESAIAAGIRRVEAITGAKAEKYINEQLDVLDDLKLLLKNPNNLGKSVQQLIEQSKRLESDVKKFQQSQVKSAKQHLLNELETIEGIEFVAREVDMDPGMAKNLALELNRELDNAVVILAVRGIEKAQIFVSVSKGLVESKGLDASKIVRELAKYIGGGGGGQPFFASAGGKNPSGVDDVLTNAANILKIMLKGV